MRAALSLRLSESTSGVVSMARADEDEDNDKLVMAAKSAAKQSNWARTCVCNEIEDNRAAEETKCKQFSVAIRHDGD